MYRFSPSFPSSRSRAPQQARYIRRLMIGAVCLLGAMMLAGCGVTVNVGGPGGASSNPPQNTSGGGINGTAIRPCTGDSVTPSKNPAIALTVNDSYKTVQAHVGDVIEVRLDTKTHWFPLKFTATTVLSALQPQGAVDPATQTCRWFFEAMAPGTATLEFTGAPICESNTACPAIARAEKFTIQVS